MNISSASDALPLWNTTAPNDEFVTIAGSIELLYACCKFVVENPPAEPTVSPNLDA
jgi:hypothetical protein